MKHLCRYRLTISSLMILVCVAGIVLAPFAAKPEDRGFVIFLFVASLVVVIPLHLAVEGNRRDAIAARHAREDNTGQKPGT